MSKYQPLADFLNHLEADEWRPTFMELERLLGAELPKSARKQETWWSNDSKAGKHAEAWIGAGWTTERPDLEKEQVTFRRAGGAQPQASGAEPEGGVHAKDGKASEVMSQADRMFEQTERTEKLKKVGLGAGVA